VKVAAATGKIVVAVTVVTLTIAVKARHAAVRARSVVREVIAAQKTKPAVAATAATPRPSAVIQVNVNLSAK